MACGIKAKKYCSSFLKLSITSESIPSSFCFLDRVCVAAKAQGHSPGQLCEQMEVSKLHESCVPSDVRVSVLKARNMTLALLD